MNHTLMKSGLRSSSRATSCRASSPELIRTIGGSPRSNFGSSTIEMSGPVTATRGAAALLRSEEHTSELQSQSNLVCRLLLEKKKKATRAQFNNTHMTYM